MKKVLIVGLSLAFALTAASAVFAHHSAAGIDQTKSVNVEGTVRMFKWANPHSWIEMEVKNSKGDTEVWNLEMNPPAYLVRAGWKSTTIKPGDKIKATVRPFKNGDPGGLFVSITMPDGKVLGNNAPRGAGAAAPVYEQK
jgi:hypothetical protein